MAARVVRVVGSLRRHVEGRVAELCVDKIVVIRCNSQLMELTIYVPLYSLYWFIRLSRVMRKHSYPGVVEQILFFSGNYCIKKKVH